MGRLDDIKIELTKEMDKILDELEEDLKDPIKSIEIAMQLSDNVNQINLITLLNKIKDEDKLIELLSKKFNKEEIINELNIQKEIEEKKKDKEKYIGYLLLQLINEIKNTNNNIVKDSVHFNEKMVKLMEEIGELAQVTLSYNNSKNSSNSFLFEDVDEEDVIYEIADVIVILLDLLISLNPNIDLIKFIDMMEDKVNKWKNKFEESF